ncbi:Aspartic protease [Rhizoctonia solani]|uniref:Aspartic protease n=1 Tax=Rhizoctonia solani TaxID=456999 RepID=A0A0K6FXD6_9AGAM|nr:Aspartic protease [Rhizoctonia solani]
MLFSISITIITYTGCVVAAPVGDPITISVPLDNRVEGTQPGNPLHGISDLGWERQNVPSTNEQGALYLTSAGTNEYASTIAWAPLIAWNWVTKGTLSVGGFPAYSGEMIIDHRSTLIIGSPETVKRWWEKVPGSEPCDNKMCKTIGFYTFPCSNPPSVTFTFGGHQFPVSPLDFSLGPTDDIGTKCFGAIIESENVPEDAWVIGEKFMKNAYTVFDKSNSRVGFTIRT